MGEYDDLIAAAGSAPSPAPAPAAPAAGEYDDLIAAAAPSAPKAPPKSQGDDDKGFLDALGRGAGMGASLGFGPTVEAGVSTAISKVPGLRDAFAHLPGIDPSIANPNITYDQRRAAAYGALQSARDNHPIASTVGEIGGGIGAQTLVAPLTPEIEGMAALSPMVRGGINNGAQSYVQNVGENLSAGKKLPDALTDGAAAATITGALTGAAFEGAAGKLLREAPEKADGWLIKDIAGTDRATAATATNNKKLGNDAIDVKDLLKRDPELARATDAAAAGDINQLKSLKGLIQDRIQTTSEPRADHYASLEASKPVVFGDLDKSLTEHANSLPAGDRNVKRAILAERDSLRDEWATKPTFKADQKVKGGGLDGMKTGDALALLEKQAAQPLSPETGFDAQEKAATEAEIARIRTEATTSEYDPKTVVPAQVMRQHLTSVQGTASQTMGALNEMERFKAAKKVERPFTDFWQNHLDEASKVSPAAADNVKAIRAYDTDYSAYKNIQNVVDNRIQKATTNAMAGMRPAFGIRGAIHQLTGGGPAGVAAAIALGHPAVAAGLGLTTVLPSAKRATDKALAALLSRAASGSVPAKIVEQAIASGIPRALALRIASSAANGIVGNVSENISDAVKDRL
jgi:hypothetical protein